MKIDDTARIEFVRETCVEMMKARIMANPNASSESLAFVAIEDSDELWKSLVDYALETEE